MSGGSFYRDINSETNYTRLPADLGRSTHHCALYTDCSIVILPRLQELIVFS